MDDLKNCLPILTHTSTLSNNSKDEVRHCAYCLKVCGFPAKKCSGCKRRAYCSKDCQAADWKPTGVGQRHKNWCNQLEFGEEDVDWQVVSVPHKGLGIVAKRLLPAGYRIIVEPVFTNPKDHPAIEELEPKEGSLDDKFLLNSFSGHPGRDGGKNILGLRSARVNHSCRPNAAVSYDEIARVKILIAQKDIHPGEEVCIIYSHFYNLESISPTVGSKKEIQLLQSLLLSEFEMEEVDPTEIEFEMIKKSLRDDWGIVCPSDCICKDSEIKRLVVEGKRLYQEMIRSAASARVEDGIKAGEKLLEIHQELNFSWAQIASVHLYLFQIGITESARENFAMRHLEASLKIHRIAAPFSEQTAMCEELVKHPEVYRNCRKEDTMLAVMQSFSSLLIDESAS